MKAPLSWRAMPCRPGVFHLADHPMPDELMAKGQDAEALARVLRLSGHAADRTGSDAEGRRISLAELEQVHRHKTGALIECAVTLGALGARLTWNPPPLTALQTHAAAIGPGLPGAG